MSQIKKHEYKNGSINIQLIAMYSVLLGNILKMADDIPDSQQRRIDIATTSTHRYDFPCINGENADAKSLLQPDTQARTKSHLVLFDTEYPDYSTIESICKTIETPMPVEVELTAEILTEQYYALTDLEFLPSEHKTDSDTVSGIYPRSPISPTKDKVTPPAYTPPVGKFSLSFLKESSPCQMFRNNSGLNASTVHQISAVSQPERPPCDKASSNSSMEASPSRKVSSCSSASQEDSEQRTYRRINSKSISQAMDEDEVVGMRLHIGRIVESVESILLPSVSSIVVPAIMTSILHFTPLNIM